MKHCLIRTGLCTPFLIAAAPLPSAKPLCSTGDRACLVRTATSYFDGILKADGSKVPFAAHVRVTEQGEVMATSRTEIVAALKTTGATRALRNMRMMADPATGQVAVFVLSDVQIDGKQPFTVRRAQRMKIERGLIQDVEIVLFKDDSPDALWPDK